MTPRQREVERRESSGIDVNWKRQSKKLKVRGGGGAKVREGPKFRHGNQERAAASFPQEIH